MHHVKMASSYLAVAACLLLAAGGSVRQANSQAASPTLDYQFFKDKVQAVFLHKREGHTRCVACHTVNNVLTMHLVPLSPGATTWNEEQSRQNFQWVSRVVVPGQPAHQASAGRKGRRRSPSRRRSAIRRQERSGLADIAGMGHGREVN
jgi:hypothetical protein